MVKECTGIVNSVLDIEADGSRNNKSRNNQNSTGSGTSSSGYSSKKNYCKSVFVKHAIQAEQEIDTLLRDLTSVESPATERRRLRRDSDKSEFSRYEKLDEIEVKIIENQTEMVNEIGKAIKAYEPKNEVQTAECHEEAYRKPIKSEKNLLKSRVCEFDNYYVDFVYFYTCLPFQRFHFKVFYFNVLLSTSDTHFFLFFCPGTEHVFSVTRHDSIEQSDHERHHASVDAGVYRSASLRS